MADVDQSLVELFLRIGLTDQRAVNTAKSEAIAPRLKAIAEAAGVAESGCDHAMGVLLYDLASKHAKVVTDADEHFTARAYLVGCIINGQLESGAQLTAAVKWIKGNGGAPPVEADDVSAFEAASGVGISYTNEEIAAAVAALIEEERETLVEQRYLYPTGRMLGTLNKQRLLWADGTVVKAELDAQILALLGPETDADREAKKAAKKGKKKGKGGGKNNKATRKDNVSEAEAAAIEAEAEALRAEWGATPKIIKYTDTPRTQIKDILQSKSAWLEQDICVAGWIKQLRWQSETLGFCEVNDGSVVVNIQCVVNGSKVDADVFAAFKERAAVGASVIIRGTLVRSPGSEQFSEIQAASAEVPGMCDRETFPLAGENMSVEFLRGQAHLRSRTKVVGAVARVRSALAHAVHTFFTQNDFFYLHTPLVTTSDCEGAGEAFQVTTMDLKNIPLTEDGEVDFGEDFFKRQAMLTVSGQLNAEAYACGISKVFTFGPTFRAEDSNTARHLAEFWMIEPEVAFCDIIGNMDLAEDFLKFTLSYVMEHNRAELEFFATLEGNEDLLARLENVVSTPFARITYTEMIEILESAPEEVKEGFEYPFFWGVDLASEHERYVAEQHFKGPVIVRDYPKEIKAFYMRENDHDPRTVAAMDVLVPGVGEIIGGSQREERYEVLERRLEELEMEPEPYWWYMDLRKYGSVKHSGFGLGFERLVMYATGVKNIRESIPFPRYPGHAEF